MTNYIKQKRVFLEQRSSLTIKKLTLFENNKKIKWIDNRPFAFTVYKSRNANLNYKPLKFLPNIVPPKPNNIVKRVQKVDLIKVCASSFSSLCNCL